MPPAAVSATRGAFLSATPYRCQEDKWGTHPAAAFTFPQYWLTVGCDSRLPYFDWNTSPSA